MILFFNIKGQKHESQFLKNNISNDKIDKKKKTNLKRNKYDPSISKSTSQIYDLVVRPR